MDSKKTSLLVLGLGLATQGNLHAAGIVNGWQCARTPAGLWDCSDASGTIPAKPEVTAPKTIDRDTTGQVQPTAPAGQTTTAGKTLQTQGPAPRPQPAPRPSSDTAVITRSSAATASRIKTRGDFELCGTEPRPAIIPTDAVTRRNTPVDVNADQADVAQTGVSSFTGNVDFRRADQRLRADKVEYNRDTEQALATGNVEYQDNNIELKGPELKMDLASDTNHLEESEFRLFDRHARGTAKAIDRNNVTNITRLDDATYTTCSAGNSDWELRADKVELDHDEGFGTARHVSVNFKGIPFFYSPLMTFPINDKRKSGFLTPAIGNSDESGTELAVPYYWNISPNRDATFTPRILSKRGLQLNGEYRYLHEDSAGQLNIEALPSDNEYEDDRLLVAYKHQNRYAPRWTTDVNYGYASDKDYFEDLGTDITLSSKTHLEQRADLSYQGDYWSVLGRVQGFQTISETTVDQYARLPQVLLNVDIPDGVFGLDYGTRAEAVAFDINDDIGATNLNRVTGTRIDIEPYVRWPLRNSWGYVTPKLGVRHTRYDLKDVAVGADDSPSRTTPIFSLDSGMFFDRDFSFGDSALLQTLEPRAYYLRIPKRDQDNLIVDAVGNDVVFDTAEYDFSFAQLFRENRFTGADRVNDADQLTLALTSRIIDPDTGTEHLKASIGEILYFRDREVTLPGVVEENDSSSALVAEINARFSQAWTGRAGIQYDHHDKKTDKGSVNVRYQPEQKSVINLSYRRRRADIEQTDLSFSWPVARQFNMVGRWNYSLDQNRTLEGFAGFEYESCCWITRLVAREYVNDINDVDKNTAIMLQLELKGLTSFGDGVKTFLERGILGYGRDDPYEYE